MAAGDKHSRTEQPTGKRKREARKEGKVLRSPELSIWFGLVAATFVVPLAFRAAATRLTGLVAQAVQVQETPSSGAALSLLDLGLSDLVHIVLPLAGAFVALGLVLNVSQVGFLLATKAAKPKLNRLSPKGGFKRLVSPQGIFEGVKSLGKIALVGGIAYLYLSTLAHNVIGVRPVALEPLLAYGGQEILALIRAVAFGGLAIAAADYAFKRYQHRKSLMMTKQEVKEEMKAQEGDPLRRRRIRSRQRELSRMRILAAMARADVVVTNPTHVAVALKYRTGEDIAPVVVAKGIDHLAARIRELAMEYNVPIVEDPLLARTLNYACEVDEPIPHELYVAVARLLAFVYSLPVEAKVLGIVHRPPKPSMEAA